jgi:ABC-type branched-subunit amino acid transport system substrate-binding protein
VIEYRSNKDSPEWGRAYQMARRLYDSGKKRDALPRILNYVNKNPNGQFADEANFLLGKQAFDAHSNDLAAKYFNRIVVMDPPSRLRGDAIYYLALAHVEEGQRREALDALAKIDIREVNPSQRGRMFVLWGHTAADENRWLESTLAYIKARRESTESAQKSELEQLIEDAIDNKLNEAELDFVEQEYPADYPNALVKMRKVSLKMANGQRLEAQSLLQGVLGSTQPGSKAYNKAKQLLTRLQSLGDAQPGRIGALLPLSGRSEPLGRAVADGLQLALAPGPNNRGLDLVLADAGSTEESATQAFEKLVFEDKVMAVVGPLSGPQAEVTATKAAELGIPYIALSPHPGLLQKGSSIFRVALTPERQVRALVAYAKDRLGAQRFAILFPEDNFGKEFATEYFDAVKEFGGNITAAESYNPNQSDFQVQIQNMVGKGFPNFRHKEVADLQKQMEEKLQRPLTPKELRQLKVPPIVDFDVIFIPDTYRALGQIVPALMYADVTNVQLMGPSTWNNPKLLTRAGQYLDGALFVDSFAIDRDSRITKEFVTQYQSKKGTQPSSLSALGYDVGLAMRLAYNGKAPPQGRDELRDKLAHLGSFDGVLGVYVWDDSRDALSELQLFQIRKGAFHHQGGISIKAPTVPAAAR